VNLDDPAAGTYTIYIHGWETDGPDASYTLFTWTVAAVGGDLTVSVPGSATTATSGSVNLHWNGPLPATRYLGTVRYFEARRSGPARASVNVP